MAATRGRTSPPVIEQLVAEPGCFDFFQAVRLLQQWSADRERSPSAQPGQRVGGDGPPEREVVRFRAHLSHTFPASSIASLKLDLAENRATPPAEMTVAFLGLTGPSGVLPDHYTSLLIERVRHRDASLRDFLDLFHHRLISLFYRAWEKYRFPIEYERNRLTKSAVPTHLTQSVYSLVGLGLSPLRSRLEIDDEAFLFYSGYFAHARPNALSLEQMLSDYFSLPVRVEQFRGQWLYLEADDISCCPSRECPEGRNCELGYNLIVGERVWSVENACRIRLGPLTYRQFEEFLPTYGARFQRANVEPEISGTLETCPTSQSPGNGTALTQLGQLVRTYIGSEYDCDFQLVLRADEVPHCQLGAGDTPARLGWNTWLISRQPKQDVGDAVFTHDGLPTQTRCSR